MIVPKDIEAMLAATKVLVIDDEPYMRKVIRSLLMFVGVRKIFEATDGAAGLEAITGGVPDIVILDWEMPLLNGPEFVRIVRSPETFSAVARLNTAIATSTCSSECTARASDNAFCERCTAPR